VPGYLVWRLAMKWRVAVDRALAPLGLTHAQYVLLASLYGMKQPPTQRELADHTGLEALYVSKLARTSTPTASSNASVTPETPGPSG